MTSVKDLTLLLDTVGQPGEQFYSTQLFEGWPETGRLLYRQESERPFYEIVTGILKAPCA